MWGEDGLCMAHVENRKPITPLRSAIRLNVFIRFTCKYTVTLYCTHTTLDTIVFTNTPAELFLSQTAHLRLQIKMHRNTHTPCDDGCMFRLKQNLFWVNLMKTFYKPKDISIFVLHEENYI